MEPIWKDKYMTLGVGVVVDKDFSLEVDGAEVYAGRAVHQSGTYDTLVKVNDILADYLTQANGPLSFDRSTIQQIGVGLVTGKMIVEGAEVSSVQFYADWSYDQDFDYLTAPFSFPIDGKVDARQLLMYSDRGNWNGAPAEPPVTLTYADGTVTTDKLPSGIVHNPRAYCVPLSLYDTDGLVEITIGAHTWKVVDCGGDYVLHYINAYGGWDSFLVAGNVKRTDTVKHYNTVQPYDRYQYMAGYPVRGRRNYVNEITPAYTLHTGILTEAESLRMHHLLESPCVYLEDLAAQKVVPVVLTGSACEFKTYRNNGCRPMEYTIEAELAQERIRR
jgi:hypothetical protein